MSELATTPDWYAADKAYQLHHGSCGTCRAAGARPGSAQSCPTGAQLWATYEQAGNPPHFNWLKSITPSL
ncbi:hypothetical protein [Diaphorobacter sp.]|uniref:hypothetical protein n=1 Tax=Diaphorobacter sp. TaxID=1934310 RepID=UPI00258C6C8B|nr:hypothetical protein [Diaphorobacter sp.]